MVIDFISTWHIYLSISAAAITIALFFRFAFAKMFVSIHKDKNILSKTPLMSGVVNALYGLLIGFTVLTLWSNFRENQELLSQEASAITFVVHVKNSYPDAKNSEEFRNALVSYVRFLPNDILPKIPDKGHVLELQSAYKLLTALSHVMPKNKHDEIIHSRLEEKLIKGIDAKRHRISLDKQLPLPIAVILFSGAIILLFVICIVYDGKNSFYITIINIAIAALIGFYLALTIDLSTPYSGGIGYLHLNSSPYIEEIIAELNL